MKKLLLFSSLLASAMAMNAQVTPKVQPEKLTDGNVYVLVNKAQNSTQYMSRTSWDGALYFLGKTDSKYADHTVTAVDNGDGTWSFVQADAVEDEGEPTFTYMGIPEGSDNLNIKSTEPVKWIVTASDKHAGFYQLMAGIGNNPNCQNKHLHLNAGSQYFVISEPINGGQWFPDFAGGATKTGEYDENDEEIITINDSTSFNWGFLSLESLPAYYEDLIYSGAINKFYADYCDIEDYATGFLATYNAVAELYNNAQNIDELTEAGISEMIDAKVDLYKKIEAAIILNETEDAVLAAAVTSAKAAFDSKIAAAEVQDAIQTITKAMENYSLGGGDITSLGQNMSFEDLSAQDGGMTSGIGAPPAGWNVYINGKQVTTAAEVSAAGITGWHGVNDDSDGEIKDGSMSYGIWVNSVPTFEISQTIEGLETGTYEITAGLMAGSNGGGSRLTTQRLFGNLNSTYYGGDYDYNLSELDNSEVFSFAGNEILTTDREMRPVTVKAFVYDGTLTFGVRTDGNSSAAVAGTGNGGSGWFKTDNFTIKKLGYNAEDALDIYTHYSDMLLEYEGEMMAATVADELNEIVGNLGSLTAESPAEEIIAGILDAKGLLKEVDASIKDYQKISEALDQHYLYLEQYESKLGAGLYGDVIQEVQNAYDDCSIDGTEAVDSILLMLNEALQECIQSDNIEEGDILTEYIKNPSFEDLTAQGGNNSDGSAAPPTGWEIYMEGAQVTTAAEVSAATGGTWCAINSGDNLSDVYDADGNPVTNQYTDGEHLWGLWSNKVPVVELSQTIKGLPAGQYTLTADIVVQNDWAGANLGMQRLFANDYVVMFGAETDYIQNADELLYTTFPEDVLMAAEIDGLAGEATVKHLNYAGNYKNENYGASSIPYTTTLVFGLAEDGDVTLGFRSSRISAVDGQLSGQASLGWFKLDNFTLTYDSATVPAGAEINAGATGIDATENASEATAVEFYSINGVRLAAPQKGINIVKMSDGTVSKVLVK